MSVAALTIDLDARNNRVFRVVPAGRFKARDGRPSNGYWQLSEPDGRAIAAQINARQSDVVIDYEHASLKGGPAPAAGWFSQGEWRPDGLYVTNARWSAAAAKMIDAKEYRYVSPVLQYDPTTLVVTGLFNVALTNNPALDGLTDLAALSALSPRIASLSERVATGFPGLEGMSQQSREYFVRCWRYTPAELSAMQPQQSASLASARPNASGYGADGFPADWSDRAKNSYKALANGSTPAELDRS